MAQRVAAVKANRNNRRPQAFCFVWKLQQNARYEDTGLAPDELEKLVAFKEYFDALYGQGLQIANWHMNGDLEPFDSFYEEAIAYNEEEDPDGKNDQMEP